MNTNVLKLLLTKCVLAVWMLGVLPTTVASQIPVEPQRERLLNGLRVLIWSRPAESDVLLKLRVHSGAAFDLAGKEGTMTLLGDILFPDPNTREYFVEEMQGRLSVSTDYDSLTITMQGRANQFDRMIEILRTALVTTQITPENVTKMRDARLKVIKETAVLPSVLADRAIATRLFGDFPYGRPSGGSAESLARVERSDLMLARERFLNPNNATLIISGGIQPGRAVRSLRQVLGNWRKSEQVVPSTFRQPLPPDQRTLIVNAPSDQSVEVRLAMRGFARQDQDVPAAALLATIATQRWLKLVPELNRAPVFVRHESFTLPGIFVMGATVDNVLAAKTLASAKEVIQSLASTPVAPEELQLARGLLLSQTNKDLSNSDGAANAWLDGDTYQLPSVAERVRTLAGLSPADVQRAASRLVQNGAFASVVLGNSAVLKAQGDRLGKIEVMGELPPKIESKPNTTSKPFGRTPTKP
ncbi:MAG TPA: insulinase family protein [Pyrinomonadaceae bacterium]|nr:insulinase family protein [Pyrinomonadaceae bacterium]